MESPSSDSEEAELEEIGLNMQLGKEVSLQDQLRFLHWREKTLSAQITSDPDAYAAHQDILDQIKEVDEKIMNSGDRGGGTTGKSSLRDAGNNPR